MPLIVDIRPGDSLTLGGAVVSMLEKSGKVARLSIDAENEIKIHRHKKIKEQEKNAGIRCITQNMP